jgi:hypothetical protein
MNRYFVDEDLNKAKNAYMSEEDFTIMLENINENYSDQI